MLLSGLWHQRMFSSEALKSGSKYSSLHCSATKAVPKPNVKGTKTMQSGAGGNPGDVKGGAAATAVPVHQVKCNLASKAQQLKPVPKAGHSGVDEGRLYRMGSELFVDGGDVIPQLRAWRRSAEKLRRQGCEGPPPLFINGRDKTGKTHVLEEVLPAVMAKSPVFGVGKPDEARVIMLDLGRMPLAEGFQSMLMYMMWEVIDRMQALDITSPNLTVAVDALAEHDVSYLMFCNLFVDLPVPVLLLIDEVQRLLLPWDAKLRAVNAASQSAGSELLRVLLSYRSSKLLVAVTGSNMALLMLQLGSSPPTCMSALSNACSVNLPPKHERWHLQLVLKDVTKRRSLVAKLSAEDRTELLDKSENVAFLLDALAVYMSCHYGTDLRMRAFLKGFKNDTMVLETMDECQSVLKGYTSAERRAILGLALPDEGLDLSHLTVAQGHRLWDLTCPVQPGSDRRILASAYHQISLQRLIDLQGHMRDRSFLALAIKSPARAAVDISDESVAQGDVRWVPSPYAYEAWELLQDLIKAGDWERCAALLLRRPVA